MTDNSVRALVIDGEVLPIHSSYMFELKKVYVEEPTRVNTGAIPVFPDKFFVPYFTISWDVLTIAQYRQIMHLIEVDENEVIYYDSYDNTYKTSRFYAQQPTFNKLYSMEKKYNMVLNLQIVFAGTLNNVGQITVTYDRNGGTGNLHSAEKGDAGDEFVVWNGSGLSKSGYTLDSWNTMPDGSGLKYNKDQNAAFTYSLTLYAQWKAV